MASKSTTFLFILLVLVCTTSCIVKNMTRGKKCPEQCDNYHTLTGKKAIVGTKYGLRKNINDYNYPFAKRPHAMGCLLPVWPIARLAKIYVCDSCTAICKRKYGKF